jgi:hypothetical protein
VARERGGIIVAQRGTCVHRGMDLHGDHRVGTRMWWDGGGLWVSEVDLCMVMVESVKNGIVQGAN